MSHQISIAVLTGVSSGDVFRFTIEPGGAVRIGRDQSSDIVLEAGDVSRKHTQIVCRDSGFFIEDCQSTHGTVHMGFPLKPGADGARKLSPSDEFRVGETKFRIDFDADVFHVAKEDTSVQAASSKRLLLSNLGRSQKLMLVGGVAVLLLLLVYALVGGSATPGPAQSREVLTFPQYRIIGNIVEGKGRTQGDRSHAKEAKFKLPASDLLVEFDYRGEAKIEVLVDNVSIDTIPPHVEGWEHRALIIRDPFVGAERKLIFRNLGTGKTGAKGVARWGIRDVRTLPLTRRVDSTLGKGIEELRGLALSYDKASTGLFMLVRGFQTAIIDALWASGMDGIGFDIPLDSNLPPSSALDGNLLQLKTSVDTGGAIVIPESVVRELAVLASYYDAELWRRTNSRLNVVRNASRVKDYMTAYDELVEAKSMFSDEADYRWTMCDKMFRDNSVVPAKVRARPEKFRKAQMRARSK